MITCKLRDGTLFSHAEVVGNASSCKRLRRQSWVSGELLLPGFGILYASFGV